MNIGCKGKLDNRWLLGCVLLHEAEAGINFFCELLQLRHSGSSQLQVCRAQCNQQGSSQAGRQVGCGDRPVTASPRLSCSQWSVRAWRSAGIVTADCDGVGARAAAE